MIIDDERASLAYLKPKSLDKSLNAPWSAMECRAIRHGGLVDGWSEGALTKHGGGPVAHPSR